MTRRTTLESLHPGSWPRKGRAFLVALALTLLSSGVAVAQTADLRVTTFASTDQVFAGELFLYTILVDNLGPDDAPNVIIVDTLLGLGKVEIQSCAFSVSQGGGTITQFTCTTGPVVLGQFGSEIGTFRTSVLDALVDHDSDPLTPPRQGRLRGAFRLKALDEMTLTSTTWVMSDAFDPNTDDNLAVETVVVTEAADLAITKSGPASAGAGEFVTYTLTVTNEGPSDADNVVVTDDIPGEIRIFSVVADQGICDPGVPGDLAQPLTCLLGTMVADPAEASQSVTITVQGQVRGGTLAGSVLSNRARVTADQEDLDRSNNLALVATTVQPSCAVAPDVPTQLFPADGATVAVRNVTLDWDFTNCAVRYRVVVRRGSVSGPVVYRATTQQTHRTVAVGPGDYFWRVSACDVVACTPSPWRSFTR